MDALEEQMQVIRGHWGEGPFSFAGEHYSARDVDALPKPVQRPHPPLIPAAKAAPVLRLAARFADEYNTVMATPAEIAEIRLRLDRACEEADRDPASLPLSLMTGWLVGADDDELRQRAARLARGKGDGDDGEALLASLPESTVRVALPEAIDQLRELEAAGLARSWGSTCSTATSTRSPCSATRWRRLWPASPGWAGRNGWRPGGPIDPSGRQQI